MERLAASLLPAVSPSPASSPSAHCASAAAYFPSSRSARQGLRLRLRSSQVVAGGGRGALRVVRCVAASDAAQLKSAREDIKQLLKTTYCHPIMVRLGWHDSGTYDKNIEEWPQRGGADGSLRFDAELKHGANAGLINALKLIQPIKDKYPGITYADLFQLASATAIEEAGGPKIPMKYGRVDVTAPEQCPPEGRLPGQCFQWVPHFVPIFASVLCVRKSTLATRCHKSIRMRKQHGSTETNDARSQTTPEARYLVTRFSRSLHPRGMTTGTPSNMQHLSATRSWRESPPPPCETVRYVVALMVTTAALLLYL